jgi:hypothetical protein
MAGGGAARQLPADHHGFCSAEPWDWQRLPHTGPTPAGTRVGGPTVLDLTDESSVGPSVRPPVCRWIDDAFIELDAEMEGKPVWRFVFGRSDANDRLES